MSNQWGRNSQVPGRNASSSMMLPVALCLALIGTAGYFWFARNAMQIEIAALEAQTASLSQELARVTAEKDKISGDLAEFRKNSGRWAGELEQEYADLKLNEVPKLNRLLDKRDADIAMLEKSLSAEKASAKAAGDDFAKTIAALNGELSAAKAQVARGKDEIANLSSDRQRLESEVADLRTALDSAMAETAAARNMLEQNKTKVEETQPTFKSALDLARDVQIKALERSLSEERLKVAALEKQLADQAAAAQPADQVRPDASAGASTTTQEGEATAPSGAGRTPRDAALVDTIVGATRGLGFLDEQKTTRLKEELVAGACVTDALESVFDKVPLILMRNLMRDFKSDC